MQVSTQPSNLAQAAPLNLASPEGVLDPRSSEREALHRAALKALSVSSWISVCHSTAAQASRQGMEDTSNCIHVSIQVPNCSALLTNPSHVQIHLSFHVGKPIRHALVLQVSTDHFCELPLETLELITHSISALGRWKFLNFQVFSSH